MRIIITCSQNRINQNSDKQLHWEPAFTILFCGNLCWFFHYIILFKLLDIFRCMHENYQILYDSIFNLFPDFIIFFKNSSSFITKVIYLVWSKSSVHALISYMHTFWVEMYINVLLWCNLVRWLVDIKLNVIIYVMSSI